MTVKVFNPPLTEGSTLSLKKIGPGFRGEVVQRCGQTDGQTDDGWQVITIAHPEPSAQMS